MSTILFADGRLLAAADDPWQVVRLSPPGDPRTANGAGAVRSASSKVPPADAHADALAACAAAAGAGARRPSPRRD